VRRILQVIAENLTRKPAAVPLPQTVPTPDDFRGRVILDAQRCLGCGMCAYVCVSSAIRCSDGGGGSFRWAYDPGACAFCGRCVERCPAQALSQSPEPLPSYARPGALAVSVDVRFAPCPDCGEPTRSIDGHGRCERCKRTSLARKLFVGDKQ
jgi:formate hydrogenlyase subunit 6/NADH:ubiquinone oxidoreductase subunit I